MAGLINLNPRYDFMKYGKPETPTVSLEFERTGPMDLRTVEDLLSQLTEIHKKLRGMSNYCLVDWRRAVADGHTCLGYEEWVELELLHEEPYEPPEGSIECPF